MVTRKLIFSLLLVASFSLAQYPSISSAPSQSVTPGGPSSSMITYSSTLQTISAGTYFAPFGGGGSLSATEADVQNGIPVNGSAVNLYVSLSSAPGSGNTAVFTLRLNGADATLSCEIDDTATSCINNTNLDLITAADSVSFSLVTTGTIVATPNINIAVGLTNITSPAVHPPIFFISHAQAHNASSGLAYSTSGIDTTGATYLIVSICSGNGSVGTLTDSKGNIWAAATPFINGSFTGQQVFYSLNPTVGTGHTFSVGTGGSNSSMTVEAFGGGLQSLDVNSQASGGGGATVQAGPVTPSFAGSLVISTASTQGGISSVVSINSGFTVTDIVPDGGGGNYNSSSLAYLIQTSIVSEDPTWTLSSGGGGSVASNVVFQ